MAPPRCVLFFQVSRGLFRPAAALYPKVFVNDVVFCYNDIYSESLIRETPSSRKTSIDIIPSIICKSYLSTYILIEIIAVVKQYRHYNVDDAHEIDSIELCAKEYHTQ